MKKIIDGKKYDTSTAKEVETYVSRYSRSDFNYFEETLYKKKTGEFFLAGEGHGFTKYAKKCGDNAWGYGSAIIPLSLDEAKEWVERYCSPETYEELFGEVEE